MKRRRRPLKQKLKRAKKKARLLTNEWIERRRQRGTMSKKSDRRL